MEQAQADIRRICAPGIFEKVIEILSAQGRLDGKRILDAPQEKGPLPKRCSDGGLGWRSPAAISSRNSSSSERWPVRWWI